MDPGDPDEPSREELESRVEQLEETVSKMLPDRRGVLKGLGAAAVGGAAVGGATGGASGQSATGQVGTESEPVDVEGAQGNFDSVSTDGLNNADRFVSPNDDLETVVSTEGADSTIVLLPGTHEAEGISIPADGDISFIGYGKEQTEIKAPSGASNPVFVGESTSSRVRGVEFRRLTINVANEGQHAIDLSAFNNGISESSIEYCAILDADCGVNGSQDDRDTFYIEHSTFEECTVGVYVNVSHPYVENCTFNNCTTCVGGDMYHGKIENCVFERSTVGVRPLDGGAIEKCRFNNCRFTFNDDFDMELTIKNEVNDCEFNAGTTSITTAVRLLSSKNSISSAKFESSGGESYDQLCETEGSIESTKINNCQMERMNSRIIDYGSSVGDLRFWTIQNNTFSIIDSRAIVGDSSNGIYGCNISENVFFFEGDIGTNDLIEIPSSYFGNIITHNNLTSASTNLGNFISIDARGSIFTENRARRSNGFNLLKSDSQTVERDNIVV